ncbi:MAG: hypothetical protein KatS3mg100_628 [Candidatus Parcubacteria bacterium]|nr:MAG: hypothetical protein KatS3mg100_628 [Candidatus Parcubacteria bacterium]
MLMAPSLSRVVLSGALLVAVGATIAAGTGAFFSDTETSEGNIFVAGSIDAKIDHTYAVYNGAPCTTGGCENVVVSDSNTVIDGNGPAAQITNPHPNWTADLDGDTTGAFWLWDDPNAGSANQGNGETHTFTRTFNFNGAAQGATLYIAADNTYSVSLNGNPIGASSDTTNFTSATEDVYSIAPNLINQGANTLTIVVTNQSGPAGVFFKLVIDRECQGYFANMAGTCALWDEKDLGENERFFWFTDVKPGDWGMNTISLHIHDNDAWACLTVQDVADEENTLTDPETELGDDATQGELDSLLSVAAWMDNGDHILNNNETTLYQGPLSGLAIALADSATGNPLMATTTSYLSLAWCAGSLSFDAQGQARCDGSQAGNQAQSDKLTAALRLYFEQFRNNPDFRCNR